MAIHPDEPVDAFEAIHAVANLLRHTKQTPELSELAPTELLKLALACLACDWDVTPDRMSPQQRRNIIAGRWVRPIFSDDLRPIGGVTVKGERAGAGRRWRGSSS